MDIESLIALQIKYLCGDPDRKQKVPRLTDTGQVIFLIKSAKDNAELSYNVRVTTKVMNEAVELNN